MAIAKAPERARGNGTAERILMAALDAFGTRGYGATSLDDIARQLGIRKQTILYWYPSKEALLDAAIDRTASEVASRLERAVLAAGGGFERVEAIVRAMFRLAARHPSMIGFLREVTRLGPPASTRLLGALTPLIDRAAGYLGAEMDAGH
ncbi:MAG: TetR family transcriptional regulator, partial [Acidimicrobiales bacterium]|nr:TetR family transcriptional regulator [Acidimicrobiales bacterium]